MAHPKKQYEVTVIARILVDDDDNLDEDTTILQNMLVIELDEFVINGVEVALEDLDSDLADDVTDAVMAAVVDYKEVPTD